MLGMLNENMSQEQTSAMMRDNTLKTSQALNFAGVSVLKTIKSRIAQSVSSTSYVNLSEFQAGVNTNGGLIVFMLETYLKFDGNGNIDFRLDVDDVPVKEITGIGFSANSVFNSPFTWILVLPSGSHTFKMKAKVNAGTQIVGATTSDSTLYILECRNANQGVQ